MALILVIKAGPLWAQAPPSVPSELWPSSESLPPAVLEDLSSGSLSVPEKIHREKELPARIVLLEVSKVPGADSYELQIRPSNSLWKEPLSVQTHREKIRVRLIPGTYTVRTRSLDHERKPGPWSGWMELMVPARKAESVFPGPGAVIHPKSNSNEKVIFEWPALSGAAAYRVKIFDQDFRPLRHVITSENFLYVNLQASRKYYWILTPLKNEEDPDSPSEARFYSFKVADVPSQLVSVSFELEAQINTRGYQFELVQMLGEDESTEPTLFESSEPRLSLSLAPAQYEVRLRSINESGHARSWGAPVRFWIRIPPVPLQSPVKDESLEAVDDVANPVVLKWEPSELAKDYWVFVFNSKGDLVHRSVTAETTLQVRLPENDRFNWHVEPRMDRETKEVSPPPFQKGSAYFRIQRYIRLNLSNVEEPSQTFAWARTIFASTEYLSENTDYNRRISQPVFASTYELAVGHWRRKTPLGVLALAGVSGVRVGAVQSFQANGGVYLGYRKIGEGSQRWRIWAGWNYRETPEVIVPPLIEKLQFRKITTMGPQLLGAYLDRFDERWGYQTTASLYMGTVGISTPNQMPLENYMNYSASAYLTYKLSPLTTALAGYTYQVDEARYKTTDTFNTTSNQVSYQGHYLSFSLIWGLQDPQK